MNSSLSVAIMAALLAGGLSAAAPANYDESKVPAYTLPDPLTTVRGKAVTTVKAWEKQRRPELLKLFEEQMFGRAPGKPAGQRFVTTSLDRQALAGTATRKEVTVFFTGKTNGPAMHLLVYLPNQAPKPAPLFLGMNFFGNQCIHADPAIALAESWLPNDKAGEIVNNRATDKTRAKQASRWVVEKVLARGFAVATVYYGDLEPDFAEGWKLGVRAALSRKGTNTVFKPDDWGAIAAWAWGLSRAMDYFENDADLDAKRVAVVGHSRLGKTALWAGARDERFAIVISNDSGCGGASLSRRRFGETIERITTTFPHWFCGNFTQYAGREETRTVDQHELIALIAPRPVYVASAEEDRWADPKGEFLSAKHAEPVYQLYGLPGLGVESWPAVNTPVGQTIGYHMRSGKHDITEYDWDQYLNFAARHFKMN